MALIAENHLEQQALDQVIFFQAADGQVSLDVRLEADGPALPRLRRHTLRA